jgi:Spy/CpxP family protein refolding chaperone
MAERVQPVTASVEPPAEAARTQVVPFEARQPAPDEAVRQLLAQAQSAPLDRLAARQLNELFSALQPTEAHGRLLVGLLDSQVLTPLTDNAGRPCQHEAVSALLRLGFPWALEIDPQILTWYRSYQGPRRRRRQAGVLAVVVLAALLGLAALLAPTPSSPTRSPPTTGAPAATPSD